MGFFILIACQLLGEGLREILHLPVPGPVVGMFVLAAALIMRKRTPRRSSEKDLSLERTAGLLIKHMGLLFIPAGVGVIAEATLIRGAWLPMTLALVGSTLASLVATGSVMQLIIHVTETRPRGAKGLLVAHCPIIDQSHRS